MEYIIKKKNAFIDSSAISTNMCIWCLLKECPLFFDAQVLSQKNHIKTWGNYIV